MLKRHYELETWQVEDENLFNFVKIGEDKEGVRELETYREGMIELCNEIRRDIDIKNAISLSLIKHRSTGEIVNNNVAIILYDYYIDGENDRILGKTGYDEKLEKMYIEMEEII